MQASDRKYSSALEAATSALWEATLILSSGAAPITWSDCSEHSMDMCLAAAEAMCGRRVLIAVMGAQMDDGAFAVYAAPPGASHTTRKSLPFILLPVSACHDGSWRAVQFSTASGPISFLSDKTSAASLASLPSSVHALLDSIYSSSE